MSENREPHHAGAKHADRPLRADEVQRESPRLAAVPLQISDHELHRIIGEGSYGEVWLARSIMGTYRAVKVVHRDRFEHRRPYEREFEGIQRFEPISRGHPGQVAVLHVGRHPNDAYYYYVMELADDAAGQASVDQSDPPPGRHSVSVERSSEAGARAGVTAVSDWRTYVPRTLGSELTQRGRFSLDECVALGIALAKALEHLHGHCLAHRDIKPSNVIFVGGRPKLADIGLVAEENGPSSFVGTKGYFPPEGPGTAQADLYSLGKLLYEISTGLDRNEFPDLPRDWRSPGEEARFLEFNEVLVRACQGDVRHRYRSARDLLEDLVLLQAGGSLKQKRRRKQLLATGRRGVVTATLITMIGAGGHWLLDKPVSMVNRVPHRLGIDGAVFGHHPRLPRQFDVSPEGGRILFAQETGLFVWEEAGTGINRRLSLRGMDGWQTSALHAVPRWAPDGRRFVFQAFQRIGGTDSSPLAVCALFLAVADTCECRRVGGELQFEDQVIDLCWLPDGAGVTCQTRSRRLFTEMITASGSIDIESELTDYPKLSLGPYSPSGKWLLMTAASEDLPGELGRRVWLMPRSGGTATVITDGAEGAVHPTWGPGGQAVYFVARGTRAKGATWELKKVRIDEQSGRAIGRSETVLVLPRGGIWHPKFVDQGRRLIYVVEQTTDLVWVAGNSPPRQSTRVAQGRTPTLSPDGRTVYYVGASPEKEGVWSLSRQESGLPQLITSLIPLADGLTRSGLSVSPDGRQLAMLSSRGWQRGIFILPLHDGEPQFVEDVSPGEIAVPVWSPDGQWLAVGFGRNLYRISRDGRVRELLGELGRWQGETVRWSPDGSHVAALGFASADDEPERNGVYAVRLSDRTVRRLNPARENRYKEGLEWHPDGERLTYFYYGPDQYDAQIRWAYLDGRPTELLLDQADHWDYLGVWSPDGQSFVFSSEDCMGNGRHLHELKLHTGEIRHGVRAGWLPQWSRDGKVAVWAGGRTDRYFEVLEDIH